MATLNPHHHITVNPDEEWAKNLKWLYLQWKWLVGFLVAKIAGVITLQFVYQNWAITVAVGSLAISAWLLMAAWKLHFDWRFSDKKTLHDFCHWLRDQSGKYPQNESEVDSWIGSFTTAACQFAEYHFREVCHDKSICCAIRIAQPVGGNQAYVTRGRSNGMDPTRGEKSKPLYADRGVARILMEKESKGVWIVPDIPTAQSVGMWEKDDHDSLHDVRHLMITPINAFESGRKAMFGILYICSTRRIFQPLDTIEARAWADLLGLAYSAAQTTITQSGND